MVGIEEGLAEGSPDPDMPAGFDDAVRARARQEVGRLIDRLVLVYDSTYTAGEITEMLVIIDLARKTAGGELSSSGGTP